MQISAKISEKFLPVTAEIGFCGTDESFLPYDERERILSAEYTREMMEKYAVIRSHGMRVCQTHMTYLPSHRPRMDEYAEYEAYFMPRVSRFQTPNAKLSVVVPSDTPPVAPVLLHAFFVKLQFFYQIPNSSHCSFLSNKTAHGYDLLCPYYISNACFCKTMVHGEKVKA